MTTVHDLREAKLTKKERDALEVSLRISKRKFRRQYPDDLTGYRFGELIVRKRLFNLPKSEGAVWECVADCGMIIQATSNDLTSGQAQSCAFRPSLPK